MPKPFTFPWLSWPIIWPTKASGADSGARTCRPRWHGAGLALLLCLPAAAGAATPDPDLRAALIEAVNDSESFSDRFTAEVWLTDMATRLHRWLPSHRARVDLLKDVHAEAARADLPPELVLAVIEVESAFDRFAISSVGARGLMQIMPFWLEELGRPDDNLFQVRTNLRYGCTILRHYLDRAGGDLRRALARYNGSSNHWRYPGKVFRALQRHWYRQ